MNRILTDTERAERHAYAVSLASVLRHRNLARSLAKRDAADVKWNDDMRTTMARIGNDNAHSLDRAARSLRFTILLDAPKRVRR